MLGISWGGMNKTQPVGHWEDKMARPGDLLSAEWWPGQQTRGGLWGLQDEMGAAVWRAGDELRESQAGGSAVNFPV